MDYVTRDLLIVLAILAAIIGVFWYEIAQRRRAERALRESEERSRHLIARAPVILWSARPDTTLDYVNDTCIEFTGMSREKMLNEGWHEAVHPDDLEAIQAIYAPAFEARRPFTGEYRVRRADGVYRWLLAIGIPKFSPRGAYEGYIGCDIDITERKNAENLIQDSKTALEGSHREIQQLARMLMTAQEDEHRRLARELHDDLTQRLARIAIDIGRIETAHDAPAGMRPIREDLVRLSEDVHALSYRLHPSVLDDLGLVEALRTECDRASRHGSIQVKADLGEVGESTPVETSLCLFRVAQEAVNNALRHAQASALTVVLAPVRQGLQLSVSDNGRGFETARYPTHASLGLASMRERIRLLNGELEIRSSPGEGTTVTAWVPT